MRRAAILDGARGVDVIRVGASRALVEIHLGGQRLWVDHEQLDPPPVGPKARKRALREWRALFRGPFGPPESYTLCAECVCSQCVCG